MKSIIVLAATFLVSTKTYTQKIYVYDKEKRSLLVEIHEKNEEKIKKNYIKDLVMDYDPSKKKSATKVEKNKSKPKRKLATQNSSPKRKAPENQPVLVKGKTIQPSESFTLRNNDSYIDALTPIGSADYNPGDIYKIQ